MLNRPFARYLLAAAAVAAALALHHVLVSALHASLPPYITFYPAVMFTAVVGGFAPGLAATALSALMVDYFILPPVGQFSVDKRVGHSRHRHFQPYGRLHECGRRALSPYPRA